jgi:endoglucanase
MQNSKHLSKNILIYLILICIVLLTITGIAFLTQSEAATNSNITNINFSASKLRKVVQNTWSYYKNNSMLDGNKVVDKSDKSITIEGQSYALLRAVMMEDKTTFDKVYLWTKEKMQVRPDDKLFAYRIRPDSNGIYNQVDLPNATDGDLDVGLALVNADKKWGSKGQINYSQEIKTLVDAIFKHRVLELNGNLTLLPFNSQKWKGLEVLNPSYFSPAHYKLFNKYNPENNWLKLSYDTYNTLDWLKTPQGLYPDWVIYDYNTKQFRDAQGEAGAGTHNFGYDAFRVFWRLSLDQSIFRNPNATRLLNIAKKFYEKEILTYKTVYSIYNTNGTIVNHGQDQAIFSGAYFNLSSTKSVYTSTLVQQFYQKIDSSTLIYGTNESYYSQNWGWFAIADLAGYKKPGM